MRVAVLCDVHGNLPALEAVLAELDREPVDEVVSGGDLVWGPFPSECLELLRARGSRFVTGNCERLVLDADGDHTWALERLDAGQRAAVAAWPGMIELDVDGLGRVVVCHGSPRSNEEILTAATPEDVVAEALTGVKADVVVCGHTHHQFDRRVAGMRLIGAGSVGVPYEGEAGAFWALLGPDVELRRTRYEVEAAAARLRATCCPGRLEELLRSSLLEPVPREEAIAHFERQAGRDGGRAAEA